MSESRTNLEIEDVLTSIRRLVSQDGAGHSIPTALRNTESSFRSRLGANHLFDTECLVLTPALRVADPAPDAVPDPAPNPVAEAFAHAAAVPDPVAEDAGPDITAPQAMTAWQQDAAADSAADAGGDAAAVDAAAAPAGGEWGPESEARSEAESEAASGADFGAESGIEAAPSLALELDRAPDLLSPPDLDHITWDDWPQALADEVFSPESEAAAPGAVLPDPEAALPETAAVQATADAAAPGDIGAELTRLENRIAEMEAAVSASGEEFEPERGHPFGEPSRSPLEALIEAFETSVAPQGAEPASGAVATTATAPETAAAAPAPETMAAQPPSPVAVEWVDPAVAADPELTADDWAEDTSAGAGAAGPAAAHPRRLHLSDSDDATPPPEPLRSTYAEIKAEVEADAAIDPEALGPLDALAGAAIDEEALRAIVAEIVRQELQGSLGERITRNVRKLVRREIQRALASRDFE